MKGIDFNRYKEEEKQNRKKSLIGTIVSLSILCLVLFFFGLYAQVPPPEEVGVAIALGDPNAGQFSEYTENPVSNPQQTATPQSNENLTQDYEDAPEVNQENNSQNPTATESNTESTEPRRPTTQTFSSEGREGGSGSGGEEGNQGGRDGIPNGDPQGSGGTGNGGTGLGGRTAVYKPVGVNTCGHSGTINVWIKVDRKGRVVEAKFHSSKNNPYLECHKQAVANAKTYRFTPDPNAPEYQTDVIAVKLLVQ